MRNTVSTVIVDERTLLREGLSSLLHDTAYHVVGRVGNTTELKKVHLPAGRPSLTILGVGDDLEHAASDISACRTMGSQLKIVVIAELNGAVDVQRMLELGADACIININSRDVLIKTLDLIFMDQQVIVWAHKFTDLGKVEHLRSDDEPHFETRLVRSDRLEYAAAESNGRRLSQRERQILACLIRGESNKAIARGCGITEATVKVHLKTIMRKIEAQNRTQAAIWAFENGLLVDDFAADADPSIIPASD